LDWCGARFVLTSRQAHLGRIRTRSEGRSRVGAKMALNGGTSRAVDIWSQVQQLQLEERTKIRAQLVEPNVVVLGSQGSGKTTIVQTLLFREGGAGKSGGDSAPEPTTSLDYKFLRQRAGSKLRPTHIWELGGGRSLVKLMDISINADTVQHTGVVIVADLSKPETMIQEVKFWLQAAKKRVKEILDKVAQRRPQVLGLLARRTRERIGENHADFAALEKRLCPVPIVLVANKFDKFKNSPTEKLRIAARTLRALAHCSGASLVYVDKSVGRTRQVLLSHLAALQRTQRGEPPLREKKEGAKFTAPTNMSDLEALSVSFGEDSIQTIGATSNLPSVSPNSLVEEWLSNYRLAFPLKGKREAKVTASEGTTTGDIKLDPEPRVDALVQEMNAKIKQQQRAAARAKALANNGSSGRR